MSNFKVGDRVVLQGRKYEGRTGSIKRMGSVVFPDWCYVTLDPKPRERTTHEAFIKLEYLTHLNDQS